MKCLIKILTLGLLCTLSVAASNAQTVKGTVKDTAGKAVPYATVTLKNNTSNAVVTYTATDNNSNFALRVPENTTANGLAVEVRSMGYQSSVKNIVNFNDPVYVTLSASVAELQGVVINSNRQLVRLYGDTLSYKVSEFANPQDRTIGDVLRKLPGITVAANGTISYNNKQISALYIGGDNLLDDKYGIATNTIPQGVVNNIQVIQNEQPIKVLQNKVVTDAVALNLEIKKGAKLRLMGQESIGAGLPGKYDVNLNAMMFKDRYKAINYLGGNNIGYDVQRDLVSHNLSGSQEQTDNTLPPALLSLGVGNTPELAQNRYFFNQASVVSLNNLVNLKKNIQLKANAYYVHDTQKQDYSQQTIIYLPGDTVTYRETQQNRSVPDVLHTQFALNINRDKYYLNNVLLIDYKNVTGYSGLKTDSSAVNQVFKDKPLNFSNEFNLIRSLKSNKIIQLYSYVSHSAEPENRVIGPGYNAAIFNNNIPYAQLIQNVNIPGWYTNNYFSFKIPSGLITQCFKTGFSFQSQRLISDLNIIQNNNSINLKPDSALNHVSWTKKKLYAEAAYDLPGTILKANLTLPVILQQINYSDTLFALDKSMTRLYFNPQLSVKYQLGTEKFVTLNYSYRNQIGAIENIYPGYILTDYRTLNTNSANLSEQQNQQAGIGFSYRKALKLFFWNISALYNHTRTNNISSSVITNNIQQGILLPYPNSNDSWMLSGSISKYSFALHTTFGAAVQWQSSRSVQIQNKVLLPFNSRSGMVNMSAAAKLNNEVNFSYAVTMAQTSSHSIVETAAHQINQLLQQASVNYNPIDALQFKLSGEHYYTRQLGNPDLKYFFADASLTYKANKWKTDFELSAVNFLNVKTYNSFYLSANAFSASSYTLQGRILLLKVLFNL
jgi:hypothetical protein